MSFTSRPVGWAKPVLSPSAELRRALTKGGVPTRWLTMHLAQVAAH